jgi:hypothetical protein
VWGWVDPLGLKCEDTAKIYHYPGSATNPYGHYSIETINNNKPLHTHQVITELDKSNTKIVNILDSPPSKAPDKIVEVNLPNAESAQSYQKSMIGRYLGPYDQKTNSCVDHVAEVLRVGGTDVPKSALGQYKYLKGIGF